MITKTSVVQRLGHWILNPRIRVQFLAGVVFIENILPLTTLPIAFGFPNPGSIPLTYS